MRVNEASRGTLESNASGPIELSIYQDTLINSKRLFTGKQATRNI
jgi:hypothetical protein